MLTNEQIKTLRPTTSFTVPPSTSFSCAPVSFVTAETEETGEASSSRVTAAVVDNGRAVWVWSGEEGEKRSVSLETPAHSVHNVRGDWPLVVVGGDGSLSLLDSELKVTSLVQSRKGARVHAAGVVDVPLRVVVVDERGRAYVYTLDVTAPRAELLADAPLANTSVLAADVGSDGTLTAIDNANRVHTRTVKDIVDGTPTQPGLALAHPSTPAAIVSLPSSSRPLAALASPYPTPNVALVVPSHDLPAVLASTSVSSATDTKITHLAVLARPAPTHVILGTVLSHPGEEGGRSVIHVADMILPAGGVGLALLVGSAARTAQVFKAAAGTTAQPTADKMLEAVSAALRTTSPDAVPRAEKAFASWLDDEDKRASPAKRAAISESVVRRVLDAVFGAALTGDKKTGPYAAKIVQTLVDRKAVADSMWEGGVVLGALVPCADWRSISRLVRTNPSLPSRTSVALLARALDSEQPPLATVLDDIVSGPTPDPSFRAELRSQLDGAGALRVLTQLALWAEIYAERGDGLESWPERAPLSKEPSLGHIVAHSSLLLDAHLPSLMAIPEAEPLLLRLQEALAPALAAQQDYRRIRAPVDAALRLAKNVSNAGDDKDKKARGRRVPAPQGGMAEEAVGKWRVEDFVF